MRIKPNDTKSFIILYRNKNGRSRHLTIGRYGVVTPDEARNQARIKLAVPKGIDPAEFRASDRSALTVKDLCSESDQDRKRKRADPPRPAEEGING